MDQPAGTAFRLAPAKINLALHVTGRRDDGYHLIESLVAFCDFGDRLSVEPAEADDLIVTGPFAAHVPINADNLVIAARDSLRSSLAEEERAARPVTIRLEKNLPVASGIGGGSSDAAAALKMLAALWAPDLASARLHGIATALGADVPMCLDGRALLARGVGEQLRAVQGLPPAPMVIVNPGFPVATADVFRGLQLRENPPLPKLPAWSGLPALTSWLETTRNDLQPSAALLTPDIAEAVTELDDAGARFARMSGSGATCFGIFPSLTLAEAAATAIAERRPGWFVKATLAR